MSFFNQLEIATNKDREALFSIPIIQDALRGQIKLNQYLAFLKEAYHHVKHTVSLLTACKNQTSYDYPWLKEALTHYIEDEMGHEEWILNDIKSAGGKSEDVRHSEPSIFTELMVADAYYQIYQKNPIGFLGMVFVLEGTSIAIATNAAEEMQKSLQLSNEAFTYLSSHGSLDLTHVEFFKSLVNQFTKEEDKKIMIECAKKFYFLYGNIFKHLPA
jgi:pyrroloquinoline quinone (PQQ) biosynthesis protein C